MGGLSALLPTRGRDLELPELEELVAHVARDPRLWRPQVQPTSRRIFMHGEAGERESLGERLRDVPGRPRQLLTTASATSCTPVV